MSTLSLHQPHPLEEGGLFMRHIAKAGAIVFRRRAGTMEVLLVHRTRQNDWTFPKGHVEENEWLLEAALREVREETGVCPIVLGRLPDCCYVDDTGQSVRLALYLGVDIDQDSDERCEHEGAAWIDIRHIVEKLTYSNLQEYWREHVYPLFARILEVDTSHPRCDVVFSSKEPYALGVKALMQALKSGGVLSDVHEMKKYCLAQGRSNMKQALYFLTDAPQAKTAAWWAQEHGAYVVNAHALESWGAKSVMQSLLARLQVPVPPLLPFTTRKRPKGYILKSERHGIRREGIFQKFLKDPWLLYYEKDLQKRGWNEYKIWSVGGKLFSKKPEIIHEELLRAIHRIHGALGLEVLSVDLFMNRAGKFFIIDVNRAPAFYQSPEARNAFVLFVTFLSMLQE